MKTHLCSEADPMGAAIYDYFRNGSAGTLVVHSSMFEDDEIPVEGLFRNYEDMPELEKMALRMCRGRVMDVGAGAGCHSLALQAMGGRLLLLTYPSFLSRL